MDATGMTGSPAWVRVPQPKAVWGDGRGRRPCASGLPHERSHHLPAACSAGSDAASVPSRAR